MKLPWMCSHLNWSASMVSTYTGVLWAKWSIIWSAYNKILLVICNSNMRDTFLDLLKRKNHYNDVLSGCLGWRGIAKKEICTPLLLKEERRVEIWSNSRLGCVCFGIIEVGIYIYNWIGEENFEIWCEFLIFTQICGCNWTNFCMGVRSSNQNLKSLYANANTKCNYTPPNSFIALVFFWIWALLTW